MIGRSIRPVRTSAVALAVLLPALAQAQTALYSNRSADPNTPALATGTTTSSGVLAPANSVWSEVPHLNAGEANAVAGFSTHSTGITGAYRFADDFTVPGPQSWRLQVASFYAFQTDAPLSPNPFSAINVRIWSGRPGDAGSTIVFGDTTTNRLATSVPTNIYRVFDTAVIPTQPATTNRIVWQTDATLPNVVLAPGTYWIDWQYATVDPLNEAFSPPTTVAGSRGPAGANSIQFRPDGAGTWVAAIDAGKPSSAADIAQDLVFILRGGTTCAGDFNHDNTVNSQDFFDFLTAFFVSDPNADFNHDGVVNSQDFFDFLVAFFGCS